MEETPTTDKIEPYTGPPKSKRTRREQKLPEDAEVAISNGMKTEEEDPGAGLSTLTWSPFSFFR